LIFERVREEKLLGKGHAEAVKDGFKYALSSILDANITTFLTAVVLFVFGAGPIQGFATTLMIGIATSLIAALFITRLFIEADAEKGKTLSFSTSITKNWFTNLNIDFLAKRKVAYVISGILILISIGFLTTRGLDEGIDFAGGRTYTVRFEQPVSATQISEELSSVFGSAEAKTSGASNQLKISTKYRVSDKGFEVDEDIYSKLFNSLQTYLPQGIDEASFIEGEFNGQDIGIMESMKVGPTIASDLLRGSFYAVLGSLLIVFLYILIRFKRAQYSIGAVAAVFHDVLIVLGAFAAFHSVVPFSLEIDQAFIAAILTVIGYSLNDTVVVFDRIREYFGLHPKWETSRNINSAINTTISRTINTSLTTLIVLITIFIFGADSIRGFMFALIIGVVVGTYSSVFIATPIMYDTVKKEGLKFKIKEEEEPSDAEETAKA
ncbi:MAG: protein translocase subunit SecF, partial [Flavobacteriaceae bacterium]|nr:protein translocase subunit SecF [Flavobacteriaceae bacterium]